MYQPIETIYNGYRFRSRLEARWAVFFDKLGVKYRYEAEGYCLDGVKYLPDFWLPEQDCFVEIKGREPDKSELEKATLLTLALNKCVYIFAGDIWIPDITDTIPQRDNDEYIPFNCKNAYLYDASELILYGNDTASPCFNKSDQCEHGDQCPHHIELPPDHLARALYRAEEIAHSGDGYRLQLTRDRELICLAPKHSNSMQRQFGGYVSIPLPIPIKELEQEFIALLSCKTETWVWAGAGWWGMSGERGYVWCECPECHKVGITYRGNVNELPCYKRDYHWGLELEHSKSRHNTPRLLAAYTAARQERFGK